MSRDKYPTNIALNGGSEARVDSVLIKTLLLFKCK